MFCCSSPAGQNFSVFEINWIRSIFFLFGLLFITILRGHINFTRPVWIERLNDSVTEGAITLSVCFNMCAEMASGH